MNSSSDTSLHYQIHNDRSEFLCQLETKHCFVFSRKDGIKKKGISGPYLTGKKEKY